jgi:hypothetical protein
VKISAIYLEIDVAVLTAVSANNMNADVVNGVNDVVICLMSVVTNHVANGVEIEMGIFVGSSNDTDASLAISCQHSIFVVHLSSDFYIEFFDTHLVCLHMALIHRDVCFLLVILIFVYCIAIFDLSTFVSFLDSYDFFSAILYGLAFLWIDNCC